MRPIPVVVLLAKLCGPVLCGPVLCVLAFGASPALAQPKPPPLDAEPPPAVTGGKRAAPPGRPQLTVLPTTKPPPLEAEPPSAADAARSPPGAPQPTALPGPKPPIMSPGDEVAPRRAVSSGSGFVVAPGRVLINWHVAAGCAELRARTSGRLELVGRVAARDEERDLALLAIDGDAGPAVTFRSGPEVRRGEPVVTYGFPFAGMLASGPTLTTGDVSALSGLRDNPRHFQISAPVQVGNSGGPLFDMAGHVVGVVVSKLNAQRIAQVTGDLPQNVNFAVKGGEAVAFLQRSGIRPGLAATARGTLSTVEAGELADASTVLLRCLR